MLRRFADVLLTVDPAQRVRLAQSGLALLLMVGSVLVLTIVLWMAEVPDAWRRWWALASLTGLLVSYAAIRSGYSRRFADPTLTVPQMVYGIVCVAVAYALAGPMRGGVFPVLMVILMFGVFQLRTAPVAWVSVFALFVFGAVMWLMARWQPQVYAADVELSHFLMLATMLPAVGVLSGRLVHMRERALKQKDALSGALARIQELATHDELTGLINHRHMVDLLDQERQRCMRSGHSFCVALLDIDHLHRINDEHGHDVGDTVLRAFAQDAQLAIRAADVLARWDGEEFILLFTGTHAPLARGGLERLRERVAALEIDIGAGLAGASTRGGSGIGGGAGMAGGHEGAHGHDQIHDHDHAHGTAPGHITSLRLTLSAGLTEHIAGETVAQAMDRARRALFEAKAQGRNRVVLY
jgi:diguanylate cyclase (GGDEF)-like protein